MSQKDYYEILGVTKEATTGELKSAYRKRAMQYHPDRNPGNKEAEDKFKELSEAYEVLNDPQKKAAYDQFGHAGVHGGGNGFHDASGFDFSRGFSDIFESMFSDLGGGGRPQNKARGENLRFDFEVTLEEAFHGGKKEIHVSKPVSCDDCGGKGTKSSEGMHACAACQGTGRLRHQQGFFVVERTCTTCRGMGQIMKDPCKKCHGSGIRSGKESLTIDIPKGIEDGMRMRVAGKGEAGHRGAPPGDLYVIFHIKSHEFFEREGAHLKCFVPIPMALATLGGSVDVPTIEGKKLSLKIPQGTQPGEVFRLKGEGMSLYGRSVRGDMYVQVDVEIPRNISSKQKKLLEEFQSGTKEKKHHPESSGFFDKVKKFLKE